MEKRGRKGMTAIKQSQSDIDSKAIKQTYEIQRQMWRKRNDVRHNTDTHGDRAT